MIRLAITTHGLAVLMSVVTLTSGANSAGRFHAKSQNLPATQQHVGPNCLDYSGKRPVPGPEYVPARDAAGKPVVPADVVPEGPEFHPIVRFDLELHKKRKRPYITNRSLQRRNGIRADDLTVGEVSVDTHSGEVKLDGQPLNGTRRPNGC